MPTPNDAGVARVANSALAVGNASALGAALVLGMGLIACSGGPEGGATRHPRPEYLGRSIQPTQRVTLGVPLDRTEWPSSVIAIFDSAARVVTIGALDSPPHEVFGHIQGVVIDSAERLYILEQRTSEVRIFNPAGDLVDVVGKPGRGPGELANPLSLTIDGRGDLLVGDLTRHVHVFQPSMAGFKYLKSLTLAVSALEMCIMGQHLFVHGVRLDDNRVIHEYDLQGNFIRSFGTMYKSPNEIINFTLSQGHLACAVDDSVVVFAPGSGIGELYGYDTTGALRWVTEIRGYQPTDLFETERGYTSQIPKKGFHFVRTVTPLQSGYLALQLGFSTRHSASEADAYARLESIVVDVRNGRAGYVGSAAPPLVGVGSGYRVGSVDDPYPQVFVEHIVIRVTP